MNDKSVYKKLRKLMVNKPFKLTNSPKEADIYIRFDENDVESLRVGVISICKEKNFTDLPDNNIVYFYKCTNPRDKINTIKGFINSFGNLYKFVNVLFNPH